MSEPIPTKEADISEIARRVSERTTHAPNVSVEMVDGIGRMTIGESGDVGERLRLMAALGTYDFDFLGPLLSQVSYGVSVGGELHEDSLQFVISFIKSIGPESEVEAMLAAQMAAVHICALDASRRYLWSSSLAGKDSSERAMTKLTRTFTTQMETLKKYRAKAQQTVRVERVTVNEGGQAIVGDVTHGGQGKDEK